MLKTFKKKITQKKS